MPLRPLPLPLLHPPSPVKGQRPSGERLSGPIDALCLMPSGAVSYGAGGVAGGQWRVPSEDLSSGPCRVERWGNIFNYPQIINTPRSIILPRGPVCIDRGWMSSRRVTKSDRAGLKVNMPPPLPSLWALCSCLLPMQT